MIPELITLPGSPWPVLPEGIHPADLEAIAVSFATNRWRRTLYDGLLKGVQCLFLAGCARIFLDGSYVTGKPKPGDFDACWDPSGVDVNSLDPVFRDFTNARAAQKKRFGGEFFPSSTTRRDASQSFIDFFQVDRFSGLKKGILVVELHGDRLLELKVTP